LAPRARWFAVPQAPPTAGIAGPGHGSGNQEDEEEKDMHTLVVQMSTDPSRAEEVGRHFREDVAGWARRQPGFVTGQWLASPDGRTGIGVVVFDSENAAGRAAKGPRSYPRDDDRAWNIEDVTVYEQLASADLQPVAHIPAT
jgi:hypothetical protein